MLKGKDALIGIKGCLNPKGYGHILLSVAGVNPRQDRYAQIGKYVSHNTEYFLPRTAVLKRTQNQTGDPVEPAAELHLKKHAIDPVRGFTPILYKQNVASNHRRIWRSHQMRQGSQVPATDRPGCLPR